MIFALPKVNKDGVYAIHDTPQNRLGEYFCDNKDNRLWVYVCASQALRQGVAVQPKYNTINTTGLKPAAAGSTKLTFDEDIDIFPEVPMSPRNSDFAMIQANPTSGVYQYGVVRSRTTRSCDVEWLTSDDGTLGTDLSADDDVNFIAPWLVERASANYSVLGFAQRDIAKGKYFWALVEGIGLGLNANAAVTVQDVPLWVSGGGALDPTISGDITLPVAYSMSPAAKTNEPFLITAIASARISVPPRSIEKMSNYRAAYQPPTI